jgi:hypothetical protein
MFIKAWGAGCARQALITIIGFFVVIITMIIILFINTGNFGL